MPLSGSAVAARSLPGKPVIRRQITGLEGSKLLVLAKFFLYNINGYSHPQPMKIVLFFIYTSIVHHREKTI